MVKTGLVAISVILGSCGLASGQPVPQPTLVDSTGKVIGPLITGNAVVLTLKSGQIVQVPVDLNGSFLDYGETIRSGGSPRYFYKTSNCSGDKYLLADQIPVMSRVVITDSTKVIITPRPNAVKETLNSFDIFDPGIQQFRCVLSQQPSYAAPIVVTRIDSLGFTPPFKLVLKSAGPIRSWHMPRGQWIASALRLGRSDGEIEKSRRRSMVGALTNSSAVRAFTLHVTTHDPSEPLQTPTS